MVNPSVAGLPRMPWKKALKRVLLSCIVCRYAKVGMSDNVALAFALIAHCLCNLNSAINPVIYYLMSGKQRPTRIIRTRSVKFAEKAVCRLLI